MSSYDHICCKTGTLSQSVCRYRLLPKASKHQTLEAVFVLPFHLNWLMLTGCVSVLEWSMAVLSQLINKRDVGNQRWWKWSVLSAFYTLSALPAIAYRWAMKNWEVIEFSCPSRHEIQCTGLGLLRRTQAAPLLKLKYTKKHSKACFLFTMQL